jgi:hypothetical protein
MPLARTDDGSLGIRAVGGSPDTLNIFLTLDGQIISETVVDLINRNQTKPLNGLSY